MAFIKGKQIAGSSIAAAKLDLTDSFDFSSGTIIAGVPSANGHVATKAYVDSLSTSSAAGLDFKESVNVATTANLSTTYSSGVLTATANGAIDIDNHGGLGSQDRVLVKDQSTASQNGIYYISQVGDASNPFTLTRSADADTSSDLTTGSFIFVEHGDTNANKSFVLQGNSDGTSPTLDSDPLTFIQFSGAGQITAGEGIVKSGDTLSLDLRELTSQASLGVVSTLDAVFVSSAAQRKTNLKEFMLHPFGVGAVTLASGFEEVGGAYTNYAQVKVKAGAGITVDANGVSAALPQNDSGSIAANAGDGSDGIIDTDDYATGLTISSTPAGDSDVRVTVNGLGIKLGDGSKTGCDAFFDDGASGARAIADITAADELRWNGDVSGQGSYALESSDIVEILYNA